jgi:hypothetical protein
MNVCGVVSDALCGASICQYDDNDNGNSNDNDGNGDGRYVTATNMGTFDDHTIWSYIDNGNPYYGTRARLINGKRLRNIMSTGMSCCCSCTCTLVTSCEHVWCIIGDACWLGTPHPRIVIINFLCHVSVLHDNTTT